MIYGKDKTIHSTQHLDIEVDRKTGEVVAVWFRCCMLPFKVTIVDTTRAKEMRQASASNRWKLNAVEIEDDMDQVRVVEGG